MEMILNEHDMVVGARFSNGTIQDYVDENNTYGLIRIGNTTANWFLYNEIDSDELSKKLFNQVKQEDHYIHDDFGELIVIFNKEGDEKYESIIAVIDSYLEDGLGHIV